MKRVSVLTATLEDPTRSRRARATLAQQGQRLGSLAAAAALRSPPACAALACAAWRAQRRTVGCLAGQV